MTKTELHVAPTGNDAAAGSCHAPLRTLTTAFQRAQPGTTIILAPGIYAPAVAAGLRGTAEQPVILRGQMPLPLDWTTVQEVDRELYAVPLRQALDAGRLSLPADRKLAVIDGRGQPVGLLVKDCAHFQLENLVIQNAATNLALHGSTRFTVKDCILTGAGSETGVALCLANDEVEPNRFIRFERVLAHGMKENGFAVEPGAAFDVDWECCLAHGLQSTGGDGFCFMHVKQVKDKPLYSRHAFPDGLDYRMHLVRCVAMRNRLDGFDLGNGVGGITLQYCLGDCNAWGEFYAKDLKVWSSGNVFRRCRMTGRVQFISGTSTLEDFRSGTKSDSPEAVK